jgi:SAM-dependent methyltransferase
MLPESDPHVNGSDECGTMGAARSRATRGARTGEQGMTGAGDVDRTLLEQLLYYEARAGEYDEWWFRRGRYDHGPEDNADWFAEQAIARGAVEAAVPAGDVADLACGTGIWTELLAARAGHVTAIDGSVAMLSLAEERVARAGVADRVTFLQGDIFAWRPERRFDAVFMGFFLSHVPEDRLGEVLATVAGALKPGGTVLFVDSRPDPTSSSPDQPLPGGAETIMTRRLNDGRTYRIVKIYRPAARMAEAFRAAGFTVDVRDTERYFQYGVGRLPE